MRKSEVVSVFGAELAAAASAGGYQFDAEPAVPGQTWTARNGEPRLLLKTRDGRFAVCNPRTGRLLAHDAARRDVFVADLAAHVAAEGYTAPE